MAERCFACMSLIEGGICSHCGNDNSFENRTIENALTAGSILKSRYLVGNPLERNGESIVYIGYDSLNGKKVRLREFFPETLCKREDDGFVSVTEGSDISFKALMTDFVELSRQLMDISTSGSIVHVIDLMTDNATIYTVYEFVEGITLEQFLIRNGGQLSWDEAEPMFMPLFYAVKMLNSHGIIHRGISPSTIMVTKERELKLKGICTSAVRAINTEISPELFDGFAAPEQYQKCSSHGEWTDIYAISAVLYQILTGNVPPSANLRNPDMMLPGVRKINPHVPVNVAEAISKGMAYYKEDRTWSVKDFISDLYSRPVQPELDIHKGMVPEPLRERSKLHIPVWLIVILIVLPVILIIFFMVYSSVLGNGDSQSSIPPQSDIGIVSDISSDVPINNTPSSEMSSDTPSSQLDTAVVNNFVGKYYEDIIATETYTKMFEFSEKREYNETASVGEVVSQSVAEDELVPAGTKITLTVSNGKQVITLPPITDSGGNPIGAESYMKYLTDNGITVKIEHIDSLTATSGSIVSLSAPEGSSIDRELVKEIVIYVAN